MFTYEEKMFTVGITKEKEIATFRIFTHLCQL